MKRTDKLGFLVAETDFTKLLYDDVLEEVQSVLIPGYIRVDKPIHLLHPEFLPSGRMTITMTRHVHNPQSTRYYRVYRYRMSNEYEVRSVHQLYNGIEINTRCVAPDKDGYEYRIQIIDGIVTVD